MDTPCDSHFSRQALILSPHLQPANPGHGKRSRKKRDEVEEREATVAEEAEIAEQLIGPEETDSQKVHESFNHRNL